MKTEEDEAFDDLARKQGDWGGGYQAKRKMAADKLQEPVAWGVFEDNNLHDMLFTQEEAQELARYKGSHTEVRPLYTAPPKRKWVGLTEQEQGAIMEDLNAHGTRLYEFARAIEAKLKEKNT